MTDSLTTPSKPSKKSQSKKEFINQQRIPIVLNDSELNEQFVRGSGHGGQSVNKTSTTLLPSSSSYFIFFSFILFFFPLFYFFFPLFYFFCCCCYCCCCVFIGYSFLIFLTCLSLFFLLFFFLQLFFLNLFFLYFVTNK